MGKIKYSIIIPTLNERENILILLSRIEALGIGDCEITVVDENSPDGTYEAVTEYACGKNNIRCLKNNGVPGLSPSIVMGFDNALGEFLCCMDGDLQHDEKYLLKLFKDAAKNDFVIGSRYVEGGGFSEKWSPLRNIISRGASMLTKFSLSVDVLDPMSGFFVIRKSVYDDVKKSLDPTGFKIMFELLFHLRNSTGRKYSVRETGIIFKKRIHGKSKLNCRVMFQFLKMIYKLRKKRRV